MKLLPQFFDCLNQAITRQIPAVLVTVTRTKGSTPRDAGTKMAVTLAETLPSSLIVGGTIGGGNIEFKALEIAHQWLTKMQRTSGLNVLEMPEYRAFPLGASLGQCCGGWVELRFEAMPLADKGVLTEWVANLKAAATTNPFDVMLLGAGHVAQALAPMLSAIGAQVRWIDTREGVFSWGAAIGLANVETCVSDTPEAEISNAPAGIFFIIMTHSHALDQQLTQAILKRDDANFYGLIGSKTKRRLFENRLSMRGYSQSTIAKLTCPLGIDGIKSKEPAAIALAITAQIQLCREQLQHAPRVAAQTLTNYA